MYEISDKVINFIEKTMKTWEEEFVAGGRSSAGAKVQRGIFQQVLSPLLFINAMMPLNYILRNTQPDTNFVNWKKRSITKCTRMTSNYLQ